MTHSEQMLIKSEAMQYIGYLRGTLEFLPLVDTINPGVVPAALEVLEALRKAIDQLAPNQEPRHDAT